MDSVQTGNYPSQAKPRHRFSGPDHLRIGFGSKVADSPEGRARINHEIARVKLWCAKLTISEAAKLCPDPSEATIRRAAATGQLRATILDPPRPRRGLGRPAKILIDPVDPAAFVALKKKIASGVADGDPASGTGTVAP